MAADIAEVREQALAVIVVRNKAVQPQPTPALEYVIMGDANTDVADVLAILGRDVPSLGWVDLYKIFEIVRQNVQPRRIEDVCSATQREIGAFTASANRAGR